MAKTLEQQYGAVRFTPDEWMSRLFGEDPPAAIFQEKAAAILDLLEPIWTRCLSRGVDVVLDYGLWTRSERDHIRALVLSFGAQAILYRVECSDVEARRRVVERNLRPDRGLYIAPETFDLLKTRLEPLEPDEHYHAV